MLTMLGIATLFDTPTMKLRSVVSMLGTVTANPMGGLEVQHLAEEDKIVTNQKNMLIGDYRPLILRNLFSEVGAHHR